MAGDVQGSQNTEQEGCRIMAHQLHETAVMFPDKLGPSELHQEIYDHYVQQGDDRRFVFGAVSSGDNTIAFMRGPAQHLPDGARPIPDVTHGEVFSFSIRCICSLSSGGKKVFFTRDDLEGRNKWFHKRADTSGFVVKELHEVETVSVTIEDSKRKQRLPVTTFQGVLEIKNVSKFMSLLATGIGRGRTWGFGFIILTKQLEY